MSASTPSGSSSGPSSEPGSVAGSILSDLGASPTPYHAVERAASLLGDAGFVRLPLDQPLPTTAGNYLVTSGGSLMAWMQQDTHRGFTVVGAHTDSPNLRVRTKPDVSSAGYEQIGMEVYGGVLLNSWLDRGLGLAGRVSVAGENGTAGDVEERLILDDRPVMIVPQLAIHLDRKIMAEGLKLDPQKHMVPIWALAGDASGEGEGEDAATGDGDGTGGGGVSEATLRSHVATMLGIETDRILSWDLMAFDTQQPEVIGRDQDLFSSGRIDNLLSSFCGVRALMRVAAPEAGGADGSGLARTPVLALYDHEEIGSESATGAAGVFLASLLERIATAQGASRDQYLASLHRSIVVSADGAHATHPNYVERHEPSHRIAMNRGVVIKRNANQRYATDATSEAFIVDVCRSADVPLQYYIHRNDLPCGSTIGPITAARLAVPTVDIGAPQLAMHSARETAGLADVGHLEATLHAAWRHGS
ncbi:MAG: M18 family aminopeptidase [Actinomycetota bacterium]